MELDLTADQRSLATGARDFLADACPPSVVRAAWDSPVPDERLRERLAEIGFFGLAVPAEHGGTGLGDLEVALILEECGRVALPVPLLESSVAALTVAEHGTPSQRERWLPALAAGEARATIQLEGQSLVVGAGDADVLIMVADGQLHAVPAGRFTSEEQPVVDKSRRVASVEADPGDDTRMLGDREAVERLLDRAAIMTAAFLLGIATQLIETTVAHVKGRNQFGRPIGSFQAVKHRLAEAHLLVKTAHPAVWSSAHLVATHSDAAHVAASVAKVSASQAEASANEHALQCHGGIGFTWEHDLHMWLKRGKALEQAYGSPQWHRRRIADQLFVEAAS